MTQPQRLGKYELVEVLGKGAMGVVYKAFDPDIHRTVAIKTTRKELFEDEAHAGMMMARFRNEARAAGRLSHPGIVAVYDYGESESVTYIAMEFIQGASLREYFGRGTRFAERDVASIMAQLLDALHHAHEQGVWHRDIKPANLIIMTNGRLKIADFGIARIDTSQLTLTGVVMGSPGYMAPEQYTGGTVDWRADLFAAGVVMYQLLTGTHAFSGTTEQVAYRICHEQPPPPSRADPGPGWERYDAVIARALAKQPERRFATADAFRAAILKAFAAPVSPTVSEESIIREPAEPPALEPGSPPALPPSAPQPAPDADTVVLDAPPAAERAVGRRWWPIAAAAVAMLSLAIVAGVLLRGASSSGKAPAVAKAPASRSASVEPAKADAAVEAAPAAAPRPEPPRKATVPSPPKAAATPPKPAAKEPERKVATASKPPKPTAREERKLAATSAPPKPAAREPERKVAAASTAPKPAAERKAAAASSPPKPASAPPPAQSGGGYWTDHGITLRVQSKLQFSRRMWDSNSGIVVAVRNGVVTLTGTVPEQADIAEAGRLAASVVGVRAVRNELKVGPVQ
jgi:serine/threonine-protein kinase